MFFILFFLMQYMCEMLTRDMLTLLMLHILRQRTSTISSLANSRLKLKEGARFEVILCTRILNFKATLNNVDITPTD